MGNRVGRCNSDTGSQASYYATGQGSNVHLNDPDSILVWQINMQHSGVATMDLNSLIAKNAATYKNKKLIICMQEPYIRGRKIKLETNIDLFYLSIPGRVTRSAIAASKGLKLVLVPSLSDPDCTSCLMETEAGRKKTLIVSL